MIYAIVSIGILGFIVWAYKDGLLINKKKNKNLFFVFAFCCFVLFW
jgi:heme/copper-type cytochrome/quinol oxidase subunit 1